MMPEPPAPGADWRVRDGFVIGRDPQFRVRDIRPKARFPATGTMLPGLWAELVAETPAQIESRGQLLTECRGYLEVHADLPERAFLNSGGPNFETLLLDGHRGVMAMLAGGFTVQLYLPRAQFDVVAAMLVPGREALLEIEVDRTLDQGLADEDSLFWNDRLSPVVLFNEFLITARAAKD